MIRNTLLAFIAVFIMLFYFSLEIKEEIIFSDEIVDNSILINILADNDEVLTLELEEYVIGVVAGEMPALFHEEALKAQAVAARTYALYKIINSTLEYDVTTTVSTQSYLDEKEMKEKWGDDYMVYYTKLKNVVDETKKEVMKQNEEVISSFYFAMSNGYTQDSITVFNQNFGYIESVTSKWDQSVSNYEVAIDFTIENFCELLDISCDVIEINDLIYEETNHLKEVVINNKSFTGINLRELLSLRSTDIQIEVTDVITITTRGYGHGVGMSQYGANEMAKEGFTYREILNYYYKNIEITNY